MSRPLVHTLVVEPARPGREPDGRGEDGRTIWRDRDDETVSDARCVECDVVVGHVYDDLTDRRLRAWWRPEKYLSIPCDSAGYSESYPAISRERLLSALVANLRDCHQVQMDALYTPVPRRRRPARVPA